MTKYYTTYELAKLLPNYSSTRTLLKALHNNQKLNKLGQKEEMKNNSDYKCVLSIIWSSRIKLGKRWYYQKEVIDKCLYKIIGTLGDDIDIVSVTETFPKSDKIKMGDEKC